MGHLTTFWSAKGGVGTTTVAAATALLASHVTDVVVVDLDGDMPTVLGIPDPSGPGLTSWASTTREPGTLDRIAVPVMPGLRLIPRGSGDLPRLTEAQITEIDGLADVVIVDAGRLRTKVADIVKASEHSVMVLRPCYIATRRSLVAPARATKVVVIAEPQRSLRPVDVQEVLGLPILEVAYDPEVSRAVDAGILASRLPKALRVLGTPAPELAEIA